MPAAIRAIPPWNLTLSWPPPGWPPFCRPSAPASRLVTLSNAHASGYTPDLPAKSRGDWVPSRFLCLISSLAESPKLNRERLPPMTQDDTLKGSTFTVERRDSKTPGTVILRLRGPLTARTIYGALSPDALRSLFDSHPAAGGAPHVLNILDFADVPYLDSMGMGMLVREYVRCQSRGVRLVRPHPACVFWSCWRSPSSTRSFRWPPRLKRRRRAPARKAPFVRYSVCDGSRFTKPT